MSCQARFVNAGWGKRAGFLAAFFIFLLCFGFAGRGWAQEPQVQNALSTFAAPSSQFTIADFDGDNRPDLAYVRAGKGGSGNNTYWLDLQLSLRGEQAIRLLAPSGGLFLEARDVNGDHAIDLVVTTAWFRRPVAVFLNNGHGAFTATKPSAFPGAFQTPARERLSHFQHPRGAASAAQSRPSVDAGIRAQQPKPQTRVRVGSDLAVLASTSQLLTQGRAPPSLL